MNAWIANELKGCEFPDKRLNRRFKAIMEQLSSGIGRSLPLACQDWTNTKAAYRFLDNQRVTEADILKGHFEATRERVASMAGKILVMHDTTEFSFHSKHTEAIGITRKTTKGSSKKGRPRFHAVCGLLMHCGLAITTEGLPLGLTSVKFWTRKKFKGTNALKRKINPTRIPIEEKESMRWIENLKQSTELLENGDRCVHIGDRESDIYELFCAAKEAGTHFLVRTCVDRLAGDDGQRVSYIMNNEKVKAVHKVQLTDKKGVTTLVDLEMRYRRIKILPPIGKQKRYSALTLTVIYAEERNPPADREPIVWKLLTDLPVTNRDEAIEKLDWYSQRWKIETFHKIIKSGCKAEDSKLRTAQRLTNLMAIFCIIAWRIFWMCMINRIDSKADAKTVFTETEMALLDRIISCKNKTRKKTVGRYLTLLAMLGGYLNRKHDAPPGNMVLWRGFSRLIDIHLGFSMAKDVGN